jgi:putative membrane protein
MQRSGVLNLATLVLAAALAYSGIHAYDRPTWLLEVAPVLIGLPILYATWKKFPLTSLLYALLFAHALVLILGGMYTYARVPLGFELQHWLGLARNPYDKIGHFMQGLAPAIVAREILIRGQHIAGRKMLAFVVTCIVLAVSATYELIEWAVALLLGQGADEFLGTQGDVWDTQGDMFMALIGSVTALLALSRWHDRQIHTLTSTERAQSA